MKFFTAAALFAAVAIAGPVEVRTGGGSICPDGLFSNPQCCDTQLLGIIGLGCEVRKLKATATQDTLTEYGSQTDVLQPPKPPVTVPTSRTFVPRLATRLFAAFSPS